MTIVVATPTTHTFPTNPAMEPNKLELARLTLAVAVPIEIDHLRGTGGPNNYQREAAQDYLTRQPLGEALLFVSKQETSGQMRLLCELVSILAFCPGGVNVFGLHFEAESKAAR
ncbi:MAG: hypothetical protein ACRDHW_00635 [Ktedonobacteraceae bacterium]